VLRFVGEFWESGEIRHFASIPAAGMTVKNLMILVSK
jgi:hypothetical protein